MATEAQEQQALLTREDLAELLDIDVRTIRRDIQHLRKQGISVPTRGQQKDIGPSVTHGAGNKSVPAGKEPVKIASAIKHSLTEVEQYIDTFCRVVYCQRRFRNNLQTALVVGASIHTVNTYLGLHTEACEDPTYRELISEVEERAEFTTRTLTSKKSWAEQKEAEL